MIKAGIIGSTGYAGGELVRILTGHKDVEIKWFGSRSYIDEKYADVYRNMFQIVDAVCLDDNMEQLADQVDVIFKSFEIGINSSHHLKLFTHSNRLWQINKYSTTTTFFLLD